MTGEGFMKKTYFIFSAMLIFILIFSPGCTKLSGDIATISVNSDSEYVNTITPEKTLQENEVLHQLLEQRPNLSADDLRATMNLSFKIMNAMASKNYAYLKSISASNVTIDEGSNSFHFVSDIDHEQKFSQSVDFDNLEYRFHDMVDGIITVGFAYKNIEVYYEFVKSDTEPFYLLRSYVTN